MKDAASRSLSRRGRQQLLEEIIGDCQRVFGLLTGSMNHDTAYAFIQIGRKVERADMTSRMVDVGSISLLPAFTRDTKQRVFIEPYENVIWMNVLRCLGGYQAYRQKMQHSVSGEDVVRFLLQDEEFPRAIGYCLKDMVNHLAKLPNLKTLYLDDNEITDSGLQALAGHTNLSILWLSGTAVTDAGLVALTDIKLENVMLNNTAVTDAGLLTLASIPSLRNISVRNAATTDAGVEAALAVPGRNERLQIRR